MKFMLKTNKMNLGFKVALLILATVSMALIGHVGEVCAAEGRFADLDGVRVHYVDEGRGDPTVVFIHGWCCNTQIWRLQAPAIAERYRVILVDLPGHGASDKPHVPYKQGYFVKAVEAVLRDAGLEAARVVLMGHSMGLSVARQYALKHPDRIEALINVDGAIFRPPAEPEALKEWQQSVKTWAEASQGPDAAENKRKYMEALFGATTPQAVRKEILDVIMDCPDHVASSSIDTVRDLALWTDAQVEASTLAIYARTPALRADNKAFMKSLFPNLEYHEWENLGHFFMFEKPDELTAAILAFLEKLD